MTLVGLIVFIAVAGLLVWAITTLVPMPDPFKRAIYVVAVVGICWYVLSAFGLMPNFHNIRIGR